jgi:hypothetical protein
MQERNSALFHVCVCRRIINKHNGNEKSETDGYGKTETATNSDETKGKFSPKDI